MKRILLTPETMAESNDSNSDAFRCQTYQKQRYETKQTANDKSRLDAQKLRSALNDIMRHCTLVFAILTTMVTAYCAPARGNRVARFQVVDQELFVLLHTFSLVRPEWSTEVRTSLDLGKSWLTLPIGNATDFLFLDHDNGFIATTDGVYKTADRGKSRKQVLLTGAPVRAIKRFADGLIAAGDKICYLSFDSGTTWGTFTVPLPVGSGARIVAAAVGNNLLTVGDNHGTLYATRLDQRTWRQWEIEKLVQDVTYHDGLFYAITSDNTHLTMFDGKSIRPINVNEYIGIGRFVHFSSELYFHGSKVIFKFVGPLKAMKVSGPLTSRIENLEIVSENEALTAGIDLFSMGKIERIRFDTGEVREVATIR